MPSLVNGAPFTNDVSDGATGTKTGTPSRNKKSTPDDNYRIDYPRIAGVMSSQPRILLHGSRSGLRRSVQDEYISTARYATDNVQYDPISGETYYLAWNVTIGDYRYAEHMPANMWGWHARGYSSSHIGVEFAQCNLGDRITDGQIYAFCEYAADRIKPVWPELYRSMQRNPNVMPEHWETPPGRQDGKTDVDPRNVHDLANRIISMMGRFG